ncbi:sugar ABC transporter permease [Brevibacillus nitrificans]|uniref:carbohydrate ABC transporter permease n=1 Tax=Brevibacillus nitrificans TaxID=651560 RepID=UPI00285C19AB|nr:sugar ABC transporter permease [Brevibacillus nitrificans]MDR7316418.1 raffinose/stachyose/melibiose transport system permease protein [Brevibacillus nitrificans]
MLQRKFTGYLYVLPCFLMILIFIYFPIVQNIEFSLFEWSAFSPERTFVGLAQYVQLFHDPIFYKALTNNIYYAVISMIFQVGGGLVLAAILEDKVFRRFSPVFRTVFFTPVIISITVIALLFDFIYHPQVGLLNGFLSAIGLESWTRAWVGDSTTAIFAAIAVSQWQSIGYIMMLFIVAIQKIPQELYEAAEMDGASKVQMFLHVTVPQVREMTFVTSTITLAGAFTVFNEVYILTGGGPGHASEVLGTYLYQSAFINDQMGYASTIANVILAITLVISLVQMKLSKTGEE